MVESRNLGQRPILSKRALCLKKSTKNFPTPYFAPFVNVLYHNKAQLNFQKREQRPIAGRIGLD